MISNKAYESATRWTIRIGSYGLVVVYLFFVMLAIASGRQKGMEKMSPAVKNFNIDGVVLVENIQDQVLRDAVERCIEAGFIKPVNQAAAEQKPAGEQAGQDKAEPSAAETSKTEKSQSETGK
jgi:hypothetical protein